MFKVDMHSHTLGSDGRSTCDQIVAGAKAAGLDGLCLTDHHTNTLDANPECWTVARALEAAGIKAFVGVEYSTAQGHLLVFGVDVPPLYWGMYPQMQAVVDDVNRLGGACVVPHAFKGYTYVLGKDLPTIKGLAAAEGVNGQLAVQDDALNVKVQKMCERLQLPMTGGSDAHEALNLGLAFTEFDEHVVTSADLVSALRSGNFRPGVDATRVKATQRLSVFERESRRRMAVKPYQGNYSTELGRYLDPNDPFDSAWLEKDLD